jgi:RibD C-terminal domain
MNATRLPSGDSCGSPTVYGFLPFVTMRRFFPCRSLTTIAQHPYPESNLPKTRCRPSGAKAEGPSPPHVAPCEHAGKTFLRPLPSGFTAKTRQEPFVGQCSNTIDDPSGAQSHAVRALKGQKGDDLLLIGSATLAQSLIELDLIDEFRLMIDPLLVGGGKRLFPEDGTLRPLELVESEVVSTGATLATYAPAAQ